MVLRPCGIVGAFPAPEGAKHHPVDDPCALPKTNITSTGSIANGVYLGASQYNTTRPIAMARSISSQRRFNNVIYSVAL
jgi:hypothetical protein